MWSFEATGRFAQVDRWSPRYPPLPSEEGLKAGCLLFLPLGNPAPVVPVQTGSPARALEGSRRHEYADSARAWQARDLFVGPFAKTRWGLAFLVLVFHNLAVEQPAQLRVKVIPGILESGN